MNRWLLFFVAYCYSVLAVASPKLIGTWQLASNADIKIYIHKDSNVYLCSGTEIRLGTWNFADSETLLKIQWENSTDQWKVLEAKQNEWTSEANGELFVWKKADAPKNRNAKSFNRRILGTWLTTDSLYMEKWRFVFDETHCKELAIDGAERQLHWTLSEDANFLLMEIEGSKSVFKIVELKDFLLVLQLDGGQLRFQRELLYTKIKSLQIYLAEQKLLGHWIIDNPTEGVLQFSMVFETDGSVQSYSDQEEAICERWKLSKRGKRLVVYNIEEETRFELELKFIDKNNIELKEPESTMRLYRKP